jgi:4-aminobutyrate aminotransferase-like enzyme
MVAIEFVRDGDVAQPNVTLTKSLVAKAHQDGLSLLSCQVNGNLIRVLPSLAISDEVFVRQNASAFWTRHFTNSVCLRSAGARSSILPRR